MRGRGAVLGLGACYLVLAACVWRLSRVWPALEVPTVVVCGVVWVAAVFLAERVRVPLVVLLLSALGLRVAPFVAGPQLSDDVYRYAWEGAVVARGESPYLHAPADEELAPLRAEFPELHARVAHAEVSAVYPPVAQLVHAAFFALGADAAGSVWGLRVLYGLCDLALVAVLARLLVRRGASPSTALAWGWCPLVVFEFAGSGHLDSLALLCVWGAWSATGAAPRGRLAAAASLVVATLLRWLPVVFLARALLDAPRGQRVATAGLVCGLLALGIGSVSVAGGFGRGPGEFAAAWEGFDIAFRWVRSAVVTLGPEGLDGYALARSARIVAGGLGALAAVAVLWRRREPTAAGRGLVIVGILLTPVLHPWYATWLVPFAALRRDLPALWLAATMPLSYAPLARWQSEGVWVEAAWTWPVIALPFLALLVGERWLAQRELA